MSPVIRTASVTLRETRLSYFEIGEGRNLLLLHGNPGTKNDFAAVSQILSSQGFRCVALDRPGHGNSEELLTEASNPWLDAEVFADFIQKICQGKAYLVGYSLGAFLAAKVAVMYPDRVQGLAMVAPYVIPRDASESPSGIPGYAKNPFLGTVLGVALPMLSRGKIRDHLQKVHAPHTIPEALLEEGIERYTHFEYLVATLHDKNDMLAIANDVLGKLGQVKCPSLVVAGAKDEICDGPGQAEKLCAAIPGCQKVLIEDGGHGLPFTHAEKVAELLCEYLGKAG